MLFLSETLIICGAPEGADITVPRGYQVTLGRRHLLAAEGSASGQDAGF